jgi:hypothetical protein
VSLCIANALSATSNSPWVLQRKPTPSNRPTLIASASDLQIGHITFSAMRYLTYFRRRAGAMSLSRRFSSRSTAPNPPRDCPKLIGRPAPGHAANEFHNKDRCILRCSRSSPNGYAAELTNACVMKSKPSKPKLRHDGLRSLQHTALRLSRRMRITCVVVPTLGGTDLAHIALASQD